VVIGSPDKDFKQLISEDVQIVMPLEDLDRWSFYTLKHYVAQYNCDPCCDLSLSKYEMQSGDIYVNILLSMIYCSHIATFSLLQLVDSGYVLQVLVILFFFSFFPFKFITWLMFPTEQIKGMENQPNLN
jgi:hypothetical protein